MLTASDGSEPCVGGPSDVRRSRGGLSCFSERVRLFDFTLKGLRARVNERRQLLIRQRGAFIWRCNPNGWIWLPAPLSRSAWTYFSILGNFASACRPVIYVRVVINECR
jgi:hypothetical protein